MRISYVNLFLILTSFLSPLFPQAHPSSPSITPDAGLRTSKNWLDRHGILNHLDAAVTLGTTGVGIELATPVTRWARIRAGYDFMPHFHFNSTYDVTAYADGKINDSNFGRIQDMMRDFSGFDLHKSVMMENTYTLQSWKVLVDVFPLPTNDHWRLTVGLYGGSRVAGRCINSRKEAPMLVTMVSYNHFHDMATDPDFVVRYSWDEKFMGIGYLDPDQAQILQDKMNTYGRLGISIGTRPDGSRYFMEPDDNGAVSAKAIINNIRPYVGVGYDSSISRDGKWSAGFDAGVMCWGGAPRIVTHDGTCLNDLSDLRNKVKRQMDLIKMVTVYPVINFRLSYSLF